MKKKAALIEFNTWHLECLDSQVLFLRKSGYDVVLVNDIRSKKHIEEKAVRCMCNCLFFDFKKVRSLITLQKYINHSNFSDVIINTAQGNRMMLFCILPFLKRINVAGTLHNTHKLHSSLGQRFISRKVKRYYLLSPYLLSGVTGYKNLQFSVFSPVFFPERHVTDIVKPYDELWACVPGYVEFHRRDYMFLIQAAGMINRTNPSGIKVKFVILGNSSKSDGPSFRQKVEESGLQDMFTLFRDFIPHDTFMAYVMRSDVILPLIHPYMPGSKAYTMYKISGSFTMAQTFNKTMLCHSMFRDIENFDYDALFYSSPDEFVELITRYQFNTDTKNPEVNGFEENRLQYISLLD